MLYARVLQVKKIFLRSLLDTVSWSNSPNEKKMYTNIHKHVTTNKQQGCPVIKCICPWSRNSEYKRIYKLICTQIFTHESSPNPIYHCFHKVTVFKLPLQRSSGWVTCKYDVMHTVRSMVWWIYDITLA